MMGSLRFTSDLSPWLVLTLGLAAALGVVWYYLRETKSLGFPYNNLLPALRGAAVASVIFILAGPIWHKRQVVGTLGRVVFAIDTSESMSLTDSGEGGASATRLDRATRLLTGTAETPGWLDTLSKTHNVDVVSFASGSPTVVWSSSDSLTHASDDRLNTTAIASLVPEGERTDLASGLSVTPVDPGKFAPDQNGDDLASRSAIVMMTDGRDNRGESATEVATRLASRGVAIHTIGFGSSDERADVGIVSVERPESVASDGRLAGSVLVKRTGALQPPTSLRIESGDKIVWQQTLDAADVERSGSEQRVPFEFDVEELAKSLQEASGRGIQRGTVVLELRAIVEATEGDLATENNSLDFRVAATTRDRRLLILDGSSRWEIRYIRNLFDRDPAWQVDTILFGPGTDNESVMRGDKSGELPNSSEAISRYDGIILGEVPPDQFSQVDALNLREFVTRGGGLVIVDGQYDRIRQMAGGTLADLVPVRFDAGATRIDVQSLEPTTMGSSETTLGLLGDPNQESRLWSLLPAPTSVPSVVAKPDAEVWAAATPRAASLSGDIVSPGGKVPWLVTRQFGAGRVFYLASDQTWRWRYKVADRFHSRFWNQLLSAAMQPPYSVSDQYISIGTDKVEYDQGESAAIRVRLQDAASAPVSNATVDAILMRDGQPVSTVPMVVDDAARGTYRAQTPPLSDGAMEIRVQASGYDASALTASTPIWVGSNNSFEFRQVSLDAKVLEEIAVAAKGKYFHESDASSLLAEIKPLSSGMVVETDVIVWQSFYWFWAVIVLLGIEWLLRKRAGLV